jgi:hypothetical protein
MGRRWWQKEARRMQNEQSEPEDVSSVEEVLDVTDIHTAAASAAVELTETVTSFSDVDIDQDELSAEQDAIEDAKDAEDPAPFKVTQANSISNKKKRR